MLYTGLNQKQYKLNTTKYLKQSPNKSKLHLKVREFLKKQFRHYVVLEEVSIRGSSKGTLYFDFIIVQLKVCVEANGAQHEIHTPFFHSKAEFLKAKQRDVLKRQFCDLNNFTLIEFRYDENEFDWTKLLEKLNET